MKVRIYKNFSVNICLFLFYFTLFIGFITLNFRVPVSVYYFGDLLCVLLFAVSINKMANNLGSNSYIRAILIPVLGMMIVGFTSALFHDFHPQLIIWSMRNWGRFYIYFLVCVSVLNSKQVDDTLGFIDKVMHVNFWVIIAQFLLGLYYGDELNGLFGRNTSGVNITMLLMWIVMACSQFLYKKCSLKNYMIRLIEINIIAIVSELRALFVFEILIMLVLYLLNRRMNVKTIFRFVSLFIIIIIGAAFAASILGKLYPEFSGFFTIENLMAAATTEGGYGHSGYIDRLNGISIINKYFFNDMGIQFKLFGMGMGNAEYSAVSFFQSEFNRVYGTTFRYLNFSMPSLYLEVGLVGLILYICSFAIPFCQRAKSIRKKIGKINVPEIANGLINENIGLGALMIFLVYCVYNNLMRTDISFIAAFFVAVPFIRSKSDLTTNLVYESEELTDDQSASCRPFQ